MTANRVSGPAAAPAPPARRRRRRWPLITLVVIVGLLVVADRVSVAVAERVTADRIEVRAPFSQKPSVHVHGFPFLTQVVGGKYQDIEVRGGGLHLGDVAGASLDANLRGVHLAASDVLGGRITSLPCDRVDGQVTLPYDQLAGLIDLPGLRISHTGSSITASATLTVPGLGISAAVSGSGQLAVRDGSAYLRITGLSVAGQSLPDTALSGLAGLVDDLPLKLPDLPYGLKITSITPHDDGVAVGAAAHDVVLDANR